MSRLGNAWFRWLFLWSTLIAPASDAAWTGFHESGGVVYLAFPEPHRVERYDMASRTWLPSFPLPAAPTALRVEDGQVLVAMGKTVSRFQTNGFAPATVATTPWDVREVLSWGDYVYLVGRAYPYGYVRSLRKTDLTPVANVELVYDAYVGASLSPLYGRIYGHDEGLSPDDIQMLTLRPDGTFGPSQDSPYHGTFPAASRTFASADGELVIDDTGVVFSAADLTFAGNLGGRIDAVAFPLGPRLVALRQGRLVAFGPTLLEVGSAELQGLQPRGLAADREQIVVFHDDPLAPHGATVEIVAVSALTPEKPGEPLDPKGVAYVPDSIFLDRDGVVCLFSRNLASIFRWSARDRAYRESLPLLPSPQFAAYSAESHRVYLAYASGRIDEIRLGESPLPRPFVMQPAQPLGLATAGEFVFVCDAAAPWATHYTYDPDGGLQSRKDWNHPSREWTWDPVRRRMYFFSDGSSPNDVRFEEIDPLGRIVGGGDSPYHGDLAIDPPLRVGAHGNQVLLGSGAVLNGADLTRLPVSLISGVVDAAWVTDRWITVRAGNPDTFILETLNATNLTAATARSLPGTALRLLADGDRFLLVNLESGEPRFRHFSRDLTLLYASPVRPAPPADLVAIEVGSDSITVGWVDRSDNEDAFLVEYAEAGTSRWIAAPLVSADRTNATVSGLARLTYYDLRVRASNGVAVSSAAGPLTVRTLPDPRSPLGPPFELTVVEALGTRVSLTWRDNATNEAGFLLERRNGLGAWSNIGTSAPNATAFTDVGLLRNQAYGYRIRAFNDFSDSEISSEVRAVTLSADSLPPVFPPDGLTVTEVAARRVTLRWIDRSSNEDGFVVSRRTGSGDPFVEIGRTTRGNAVFEDASTIPNRSYEYRVAAFNAFGTTAHPWEFVSATTPRPGGTYRELTARHGDLVYFAFSGPNRLERFDLSTGRWLEPLAMSGEPSALLVVDEGIYLAVGRQVTRYDHRLENGTAVGNRERDVRILFAWRDYLYAGDGGSTVFLVVRRSTGQILTEANGGSYGWNPAVAVSDSLARVFARTANVSPSDILSVELLDDGRMGVARDSPYHGSYPSANAAWLSPDQSRVVDSAGVAYRTSDLTFAGALGGAVEDLAFVDNERVIGTRDRTLVAFSGMLIETGRRQLDARPLKIHVAGTNVVAFVEDPDGDHGVAAIFVALSDLAPETLPEPPSLPGRTFTPEMVFLDRDGVLNLLDRELRALFRWSVSERQPLAGRTLLGSPTLAAYAANRHRLYLAYEAGQVTRLDLGTNSPETGFMNLPNRPLGLAAVGDLLFTCDASGPWVTHSTYAPDGRRLAYKDWNYFSREYVWSPVLRRLFFFRDDTSPNDLHSEVINVDGTFGEAKETPYHGEVGTRHPIRVRPDGALVLLGSGQLFDAARLERAGTLPNEIDDAVWVDQALVTVRGLGGVTQIQRWSGAYVPIGSVELPGAPVRLFPLEAGFLLVTIEEGQPRFTLLSTSLATVYRSPINRAPVAVSASAAGFLENLPAGAVVARLAASDPDDGDTHVFTAVGGDRDVLRVEGNALVLVGPVDFESRPSVSIALAAQDPAGLSVTNDWMFAVGNVNEAPTDLALSPSAVVDNAAVGDTVGTLTVQDPEGPGAFAFTLLDDAGGRFSIRSNLVVVASPLRFAQGATQTIRVRVVDSGGLSYEESLVVTVREYVEPPPLGEITLHFESPTEQNTIQWVEAGFEVYGPALLRLVPGTAVEAKPHGGSGYLAAGNRIESFELRHRTGQIFQVLGLGIAESPRTELGASTTVTFRGYPAFGGEVVHEVILDGVLDGPGGADDFQFVALPDSFRSLRILAVHCRECAVDNVELFVGAAPARPVVRFLTPVATAYEPEQGGPEMPPFPHTGRLALARIGSTAGPLTVQLSTAGSASTPADYFVEGWSESRTVTFPEGQSTVWIEVFPVADAVPEGVDSARFNLELGTAYARGERRTAEVRIHETEWSAWLARRWPGTAEPSITDPTADADGDGLSNSLEFLLGRAPDRRADIRVPAWRYRQGRVEFEWPRRRTVSGGVLRLEVSADLVQWLLVPSEGDLVEAGAAWDWMRDSVPAPGPAAFYRWRALPSGSR